MKKRIKIIVLVVLVLVGVLGVGAYVYTAPMRAMAPSPTGAVPNTSVLALNNRMNSLYFVPCDGGYILIDAGSDGGRIQRELSEIDVDPEAVRHILLTHSDSDHVAALPLFPNADIYMAGQEAQMVNGTTKRNAVARNSLPGGIALEDVAMLGDGQELELDGVGVLCLAAPGHTPGSMAYLVDGQYLFTGDALMVDGGVMSVHPFTMDSGTARATLDELAQAMASAGWVFTAHYGHFAPEALTVEE